MCERVRVRVLCVWREEEGGGKGGGGGEGRKEREEGGRRGGHMWAQTEDLAHASCWRAPGTWAAPHCSSPLWPAQHRLLGGWAPGQPATRHHSTA